jgi:hypothetical protein
MIQASLEKRLTDLESQVAELRAISRQRKDWRRTIGAFTDDPGMQEILKEAMRLREEDRAKARRKKPTKRKSRS